jgi:predicted N-acetyltransferase YhbS
MVRRRNQADIRIRAARAEEAAALSGLSLRSKAHWGYDSAFIDACTDELRVEPAAIDDTRQVWRVAVKDSGIAGVYGLTPMDADTIQLEALFVEPELIGAGIGACLVDDAMREARARGYQKLIIQGDPHAAGFYVAIGARQIGERESGSIPGRYLPLFELSIQ